MLQRVYGILVFAALVAASANAQTGVYPFGSFDSLGVDTIDRGSLNVHIEFPVVTKQGRGLPFQYTLVYDGLVWTPQGTAGNQTWALASELGLHGRTSEGFEGYLSYNSRTVMCTSGKTNAAYFYNYAYHDEYGVAHPLPYTANYCTPNTFTGAGLPALDGSGYSYNGSVVSSKNGRQFVVPANNQSGSGTVTDSNGNKISNNGDGTFTDTFGLTALTITGNGTAASPRYFTFNTPTGTAAVTISYHPYTVQTVFGCSNVGEYNLPQDLPNTITLADGSVYTLTYEQTPGNSANVTGRLASLTLPQGGVISYTYPGAKNGIECADGTPTGLTRTMAGATRTYTRPASAMTATTSQTNITDGLNNILTFNFDIAGLPENFYETSRTINQGASTQLLTRQTCYNTAPCTSTSITLPIGSVDTYQIFNGVQMDGSMSVYNSFGLQTSRIDYDFGSATARGSALRTETWNYPTSGIVNLVSSDSVVDGQNHQIGLTAYAYDETTGTGHAALVATSGLPNHNAVSGQRGNLTTITQSFSTGGALTTASAYEDTGNALSVTAPAGATTFAYDSATHAFTTTATPPTPSSGVSLPTLATYDANSGVQLTAVDPNSQTTTYETFDGLLRPTEIDYPDGGKMIASYTPTTVGVYQYMTGTTHTNTQTSLNSFGQLNWVAVANGTSGYYWNNYCYDGNGNLQYAAYRFAAADQSGISCSGAGDSYTYDALGRVTKITHGDGSSAAYGYTGRDTEVTDENGVSRIIQVDGLGRPIWVCEISGSSLEGTTPTTCGLDIGNMSGYLTNYVYTADTSAGNALKIEVAQPTAQAPTQMRIFETDWLGRTTLTTEAESGTTNYSYAYSSTAGLGLTVTRKKPAANQSSPSVLTNTTTQYDSVGRVVSVSYTDGTPTKTFNYDATTGWAEAGQQTNLKGRLSAHNRATGMGNAGSIYGYDAMGRVVLQYSCLPSGCGTVAYDKRLAYTYNTAGMLTSESDGAGDTYTYSRSIAGELTGLTNSFSDGTDPANLIVPSSVQNGPFGPLAYNLGNNLTAVNNYDTLGRNSGGWVCAGSSQATCTGGTQDYGYTATRTGTHVTEACDTSVNVCNSFGYDEFNRLTSRTVNQGTVQNFTYGYDRFGNRWSQLAPQGGPSLNISFNQGNNIINTSGYSNDVIGNISNDTAHTYSYDADGNLTKVDNGATATYYYDSLNQRVRMAPTRGTFEFVFDAFGRRVSTWIASSHAFSEALVYSDSGPVAFRSGGSTHFEHTNWMGTKRAVTGYNGAVEEKVSSLPWGDGRSVAGEDWDWLDFAGLDFDPEDNTEHAQFRQYSTNLGRMQSPDPYLGSYDLTNPQSFNRYTYSLNDPVNFVDPSGLYATQPIECGVQDDGTPIYCISTGNGSDPNDPGLCDYLPFACPGQGTYVCPPSGAGCSSNQTGGGNPGGPSMNPARTALLSAPNNGVVGCLVKGAVVGAVGAVAVGALAVGAVAVGAPVAAVTAVLGVVAVAGGAALGYDTIGQIRSGNWAGVAYNAGSVLGGAAVGGGGGGAIAEGINGVASPAWSWASDVAQRFNPSLGSVGQWLGTGPNPGSAGGSAAAAGAGAAQLVKKGC